MNQIEDKILAQAEFDKAKKIADEAMKEYHNHSIINLLHELDIAYKMNDKDVINRINEEIKNKNDIREKIFEKRRIAQDNLTIALDRLLECIDKRHTRNLEKMLL